MDAARKLSGRDEDLARLWGRGWTAKVSGSPAELGFAACWLVAVWPLG